MIVEQKRWNIFNWDHPEQRASLLDGADLVVMFGSKELLKNAEVMKSITELYSSAHCFGCSTAGEILGTAVRDESIVTTAVKFNSSLIWGFQTNIDSPEKSYDAGKRLASGLPTSLDKKGINVNLMHVLVFSDGINVNGSELVRGLSENLPGNVSITGGLAGDGESFNETYVFFDSFPEKNHAAVIGLYGDKLKIGYGSFGGWDPFGPERRVTRSEKGNVLYELDGQSALTLYKRYLGKYASGLPAAGLLFPLEVKAFPGDTGVVRTLLSIDEKEMSMRFAGDVPEGSYARLMKANFNRLIDGAEKAADICSEGINRKRPDVVFLISCIGRKLVLRQRTEEEIESVRKIMGSDVPIAGFYSYGEISPFGKGGKCELHNQTMTVLALSEE